MMNVEVIRRAEATLAEAEALLAVERSSLQDSPYTPQEVLQVLQRPEHHAYLAWQGAEAVGFCSCFETPTEGGPRLEIDLLGVLPAHRRRGLATRLIAHSLDQASRRGLRAFRGVVAVDNIASQGAFYRAGLRAEPQPRTMLIYEVRGVAPCAFLPPGWTWQVHEQGHWRTPAGDQTFSAAGPVRTVHRFCAEQGSLAALAECLQVHTLSYRGLWLEQLWANSPQAQQCLARALVERAKVLDLDEVGYLAPRLTTTDAAEEGLIPWLREGYQRVERLYWVFLARRP